MRFVDEFSPPKKCSARCLVSPYLAKVAGFVTRTNKRKSSMASLSTPGRLRGEVRSPDGCPDKAAGGQCEGKGTTEAKRPLHPRWHE